MKSLDMPTKMTVIGYVVVMASMSIFIACAAFAGDPQPKPELTFNFPGRVYHIVDGDTVDIETTIRFRVRVRETWTPESRTRDLQQKKLGLAAKDNLTKTALGKRVVVVLPFSPKKTQSHTGRIDDVQTMSRWLCEVWINGEKRIADIQFQGGFSGRTKKEQQELFQKQQIKMEVDP